MHLFDSVIYYHDGAPHRDLEILEQDFGVTPVRYRFPKSSVRRLASSAAAHFSDVIFSKYESLHLLQEFDQVVYLDYDVVPVLSLSAVRELTSGFCFVPNRTTVQAQFSAPISGYEMNILGMNAGFFVMNRDIGNVRNLYDFCISQTIAKSTVLVCPEQGIFDLMIQEFSVSVHHLSSNEWVLHPRDLPESNAIPVLLHASGQPKFWSGLDDERWNAAYQTWLQLGGSAIRDRRKARIIRKAFARFLRPMFGMTHRFNLRHLRSSPVT